MAAHSFEARLEESSSGRGGHWVVVPGEVMSALTSAGRAKVKATFNGRPYRGSIAGYSGRLVAGAPKAILVAAGLKAGDPVRVTLELDTEERAVEVPPDLAERPAAEPALRPAWDKLSFTARKERAGAIAGAKRPETRRRRLEQVIEELQRSDKGGEGG